MIVYIYFSQSGPEIGFFRSPYSHFLLLTARFGCVDFLLFDVFSQVDISRPVWERFVLDLLRLLRIVNLHISFSFRFY